MTKNTNTQSTKALSYKLGDTIEYLQGTYEVVEVLPLTDSVHLKNVHEPFNSTVVGYSELVADEVLGLSFDAAVEKFGRTELAGALGNKG